MLEILRRNPVPQHWKSLPSLSRSQWPCPFLWRFREWRAPIELIGTSAFLIVLLWKFPKWQVSSIAGIDSKDRFDRENEARKTLSQILGGIILLAGFYFTWQNLKAAQETLDITKRSQAATDKATQENLRIASEGQITDRFTKAIAQIGDAKLEIRLGGIYALERIGRDSERDYQVVMAVLATYVREHSPRRPGDLTLKKESPRVSADVQAILTVIARREANKLATGIDLHGLSRAQERHLSPVPPAR
jgi:hypothetical protein